MLSKGTIWTRSLYPITISAVFNCFGAGSLQIQNMQERAFLKLSYIYWHFLSKWLQRIKKHLHPNLRMVTVNDQKRVWIPTWRFLASTLDDSLCQKKEWGWKSQVIWLMADQGTMAPQKIRAKNSGSELLIQNLLSEMRLLKAAAKTRANIRTTRPQPYETNWTHEEPRRFC